MAGGLRLLFPKIDHAAMPTPLTPTRRPVAGSTVKMMIQPPTTSASPTMSIAFVKRDR
jgi:hypothetical protein